LINIEPFTVLIHLVFFLVMVFLVLNPLLFKPILRVIDERESRVDGNLEAAEKARKSSDQLKGDYEQQMEEARKEAIKEKEKIKKAALQEEEQIVVAAREKAGNLVADMREKIAAEYNQAKGSLQAEAEEMGRQIAGKILGRPV